MKIVNSIVASLVTVLLSFGAFAADEIQKRGRSENEPDESRGYRSLWRV